MSPTEFVSSGQMFRSDELFGSRLSQKEVFGFTETGGELCGVACICACCGRDMSCLFFVSSATSIKVAIRLFKETSSEMTTAS